MDFNTVKNIIKNKNIKKILIIGFAIILMVSNSMCLKKITTYEENANKNHIIVSLNGTSYDIGFRTTIKDALQTKLINTNDEDIRKTYKNTKIVYLIYNHKIPYEKGGITIVDFATKIRTTNRTYPHIVVDDTVFKNESEREMVKNSNITMIVEFVLGNNTATIKKIGDRHYIIEGNSLKELDKAETRFLLAIFVPNKSHYSLSILG